MRVAQIVACALLISGTAYASDKKINEKLVADIKTLQPKPRAALEDWIAACYEAAASKSCDEATRKWFAIHGDRQKNPDNNTANGMINSFASALNNYQFKTELRRLSGTGTYPSNAPLDAIVGSVRTNYRESVK